MRNASRKSPVTTSESESVPATSHWSFANVTEKTVAKNRPSRKGARSATARGRSRAIVAMSRHGRSARRLDLEPGVEAGPTSLGGRARTLGIGRDSVVQHFPASAAVGPHLGVDIPDPAYPCEELLRLGGCRPPPEHEIEVGRLPGGRLPDAVRVRGEMRAVCAHGERVAEERHHDDRGGGVARSRAGHEERSCVAELRSNGIATATSRAIAPV